MILSDVPSAAQAASRFVRLPNMGTVALLLLRQPCRLLRLHGLRAVPDGCVWCAATDMRAGEQRADGSSLC